MRPTKTILPVLPLALALGFSYFFLGWLSLLVAFPPDDVAAVWPASGLAVAACLIFGYRVWPGILIGATLLVAATMAPFGPALLIGAGNTMSALLIAWLTRRYTQAGLDAWPCDAGDVFKFVMFALIGSTLSAAVGSTTLDLANGFDARENSRMLLTWLLADLTGIIIVGPAIITSAFLSRQQWDRRKLAELALFALSFVLCGFLVFTSRAIPPLFLFIPLIAWLAFRFTQNEVALANLALAAITIEGVLSGKGALARIEPGTALLTLQVFVSVVGITGLALAATVDERRRAVSSLQKLQGELESAVARRTAQLVDAVSRLKRDMVLREKAERELRAKDRQLEEAQRLAHLGSWEWNAAKDVMTLSAEMIRIYEIRPEQQQSLTYAQYLQYIPQDERSLVDWIVQAALSDGQDFAYDHRVIRPDGDVRYLHCRGVVTTDNANGTTVLYGTAHDLTDERRLEANLQEAEKRYRTLVELSPNAIYLLEDGRYAFSNAAGVELLGAQSADTLIGKRFLDFFAPDSRQLVEAGMQQLEQSASPAAIEARLVTLDAVVRDIELAATLCLIKGRRNTLVVARDISERKKAERQIYHLAHHDALTGLSNRILFRERLEHALAQSHRSHKPLFVLFIDLDRFKTVNDTAGHNAGDDVLRECAQRLRSCLRDSDTIARAGGDEFLLLIESVSDPLHIPAVAQKILSSMQRPFFARGKEFTIGASIGISTYPADGEDVETLVKHADIAMYRAKTDGRAHFCYYSASMTRQSLERYAMESALRHALERNEMELYFQPKISLLTGRISGAEALIRWNHPEYGLLQPNRFIPLAEDIGLIADFGLWAIHEVCRRAHEWQRLGLPRVRVAVNLAFSQFADDAFFAKTAQLLKDYGLGPDILELEITESMLMENAERLMSTLQQLKRLGVRLSVDDFGTGYSSLAYLKRLPVDSVKVDRSFIKDLPTDAEDVAITHAVLALVHSLKRTVVAEGVETEEQLRFLRDNHCDEVQGFYFSPPLPEQAFRQFVSDGKTFMKVAGAAA